MKISINQLKTCPINSEIYRDSDVGDLVNSIGEVGVTATVNVDGLFARSSRIKIHIHYLPSKISPSTPSSPVSNSH